MVTQTLNSGTELAGYRIEGVAGEGGMGIVYRATQLALGRPVALKLISREHAGDESFRARFKRESQLAALIDHPNVLPVYEAGEAGGLPFIAMRFVAGVDLRALLEREPLDRERSVDIVGQVAAALDAAHRRGLVHCDVKPANVLLDAEGGHVYLTDFGVSKQAGSGTAVTQAGVFVGTIHVLGDERELEPDGVVIELAEREVVKAGLSTYYTPIEYIDERLTVRAILLDVVLDHRREQGAAHD